MQRGKEAKERAENEIAIILSDRAQETIARDREILPSKFYSNSITFFIGSLPAHTIPFAHFVLRFVDGPHQFTLIKPDYTIKYTQGQ